MDKYSGRASAALFLTGVFIVGVTVGSIMGLGGTAEAELVDDPGIKRYLTTAALTNLPFWCAVFLPRTFRHRLGFSSLALLVKGVLIGCSGVFLLSSTDRGLYLYGLNILPQLAVMAPLMIFTAVRLSVREDGAYTYPSILTNFLAAVLTTFLSSCVQYLFFLGFYTIQVAFITKF